MRTWIFQGNPTSSTSTVSRPALFAWLVTRYADEIREGDRVFIWRTGGQQGAPAGIVAEAEVVDVAEPRSEAPDALPFWRSEVDPRADVRPRALLRLLRTTLNTPPIPEVSCATTGPPRSRWWPRCRWSPHDHRAARESAGLSLSLMGGLRGRREVPGGLVCAAST